MLKMLPEGSIVNVCITSEPQRGIVQDNSWVMLPEEGWEQLEEDMKAGLVHVCPPTDHIGKEGMILMPPFRVLEKGIVTNEHVDRRSLCC